MKGERSSPGLERSQSATVRRSPTATSRFAKRRDMMPARDDCEDRRSVTNACAIPVGVRNVRHIALLDKTRGPRASPGPPRPRRSCSRISRDVARGSRGDSARMCCVGESSRSASANNGEGLSASEDERTFDVIVIGAGHAGCRSCVCRGATRLPRRIVHAVARDRRAHAVQSGGWRHRQGPPRSRDRRARRLDGPRRSTPPASSSSCSIAAAARRLVAARAGGQEALRPWVATPRARTEHRVDLREGRRILVEHGRVVGLAIEEGEPTPATRSSSPPARSSTD